ncbi:SpoIIE family protein phosphatase [Candidatus Poribacteria bacterium]|nr:SpoIIE family protein phosphatase [Candidatus Poribacteria bacterium]
MKDPSKPLGDSLQTPKTQSTAEQTMERLIFSLSELENLGQTVISGHSNFNHSSKTYLRITLGTLQIRRGAILRYHSTGQNLDVVAATPDETFSSILVEPDELEALLKHPFIENTAPPDALKPFFARSAKLSETIDIRLWIPLKIQDEFLGMIGLGKFLARDALETWEKELLTTLAHQISIAIAYSQMVEGIQSEKFRLFMLAESAPQICQLLQPEAAAEQVVQQAVSLLDANAGALMLTDTEQQALEMHYAFPENLLENSTVQDNTNGLVISYGEDTPLSEEAMSVEVLKSVVKEGIPGHCLPKFDTLFGGKNLMAVPIPGRDGDILGVLVVGDKEERGGRITSFTDEDVILLDSFAKQAGVAIENAQLHQEALEARQLQAEMEEARKIQVNLIPETLPDIPGYEVAGHYEPRGPVGGDYYDCIALPTGHWGLAIADVSGKGMQAALLMATLRAGLISELSRAESVEQETPNQSSLYAEIATMAMILNSLLYASGTEEKYATFFYSHLNPETDILTTLNAGHNPPLLIRKDGTYKWLGEDVGGIPLGMFPNDMVSSIADYEAEHVQLASGDVIVYYTDGVTETVNVEDDYYEEERLVEASKACKDESAEGIRKYLHNAVMEFQGEADQFDDLTLLILRKE